MEPLTKQGNVLAIEKYSFDNEYPGWHTLPKGDKQIEIAFKWMKWKKIISLSNGKITKLETTIENKKNEHKLVKDVKDVTKKSDEILREKDTFKKKSVMSNLKRTYHRDNLVTLSTRTSSVATEPYSTNESSTLSISSVGDRRIILI